MSPQGFLMGVGVAILAINVVVHFCFKEKQV